MSPPLDHRLLQLARRNPLGSQNAPPRCDYYTSEDRGYEDVLPRFTNSRDALAARFHLGGWDLPISEIVDNTGVPNNSMTPYEHMLASLIVTPLGVADPRREFSAFHISEDSDFWNGNSGIEGGSGSVEIPYPTNQAACFLTRVKGKMQSASSRVGLSSAGADWSLSVSGGSQEMLASARCVEVGEVVTGHRYHPGGHLAGHPPTYQEAPRDSAGNLLSTDDWACLLSGIEGRLGGSQTWIEASGTPGDGGHWGVYAQTDQEDSGLRAETTCFPVNGAAGYTELHYDSGISDETDYFLTVGLIGPAAAGASTICGFHRIHGMFDGLSEWLTIHPSSNLGDLSVFARFAAPWSFHKNWGKADTTGYARG